MGQPLKVGNRHERYSRVKNKKAYDENFDIAFGRKDLAKQAGRTTIIYRKNEKIVLRDHDKWVAPPGFEDPTEAKKGLPGGVSAYDIFKVNATEGAILSPPSHLVGEPKK